MLSAREAQLISNTDKDIANTIFIAIAEQCDRRIKYDARRKTHTRFIVPQFLFGLPTYDTKIMYTRLYQSLKNRGYSVFSVPHSPYELYIDWSSKKVSFQV